MHTLPLFYLNETLKDFLLTKRFNVICNGKYSPPVAKKITF